MLVVNQINQDYKVCCINTPKNLPPLLPSFYEDNFLVVQPSLLSSLSQTPEENIDVYLGTTLVMVDRITVNVDIKRNVETD